MEENKNRRTILIVGETIEGRLSAGSKRLGRQARQLAGLFDSQAVGIIAGHRVHDAARAWSDSAGISVIFMDSERLRYPNPPLTVAGLLSLAKAYPSVAVCFPHSLRACQMTVSHLYGRSTAASTVKHYQLLTCRWSSPPCPA